MSLSAQSFHHARSITVAVNGQQVGRINVQTEGLQEFNFDLPAAVVGDGNQMTITITDDHPDSPADVGIGKDTRKLSVMVDWVRFTIQK